MTRFCRGWRHGNEDGDARPEAQGGCVARTTLRLAAHPPGRVQADPHGGLVRRASAGGPGQRARTPYWCRLPCRLPNGADRQTDHSAAQSATGRPAAWVIVQEGNRDACSPPLRRYAAAPLRMHGVSATGSTSAAHRRHTVNMPRAYHGDTCRMRHAPPALPPRRTFRWNRAIRAQYRP